MDTLVSPSQLKTPEALAQAWDELQQQQPHLRIREAARLLEVSEAELVATQIGNGVTRLNTDWETLLTRLPELGRVMSLTRNEACVLEHKGAFEKVNVFGKGGHYMATVLGPIETRVFLNAWHVAFAVHQEKGDRTLISLQVFDRAGEAITKIYLQEESNEEAYEALVAELTSENQQKVQPVSPYETKMFAEDIDAAAFLSDWAALKDTHDFFPMLRRHNIHRYHAIELAQGQFTEQVQIAGLQPMLEAAAKQKLPIMIFAGNRGNLQIHQDRVRTIRLMERGETRWLNVLDPDFNMHLREDLIDTAWIVTKPTQDGDVTSLECYNAERELVVQFFGLRKPGQAELGEWRALVAAMPR